MSNSFLKCPEDEREFNVKCPPLKYQKVKGELLPLPVFIFTHFFVHFFTYFPKLKLTNYWHKFKTNQFLTSIKINRFFSHIEIYRLLIKIGNHWFLTKTEVFPDCFSTILHWFFQLLFYSLFHPIFHPVLSWDFFTIFFNRFYLFSVNFVGRFFFLSFFFFTHLVTHLRPFVWPRIRTILRFFFSLISSMRITPYDPFQSEKLYASLFLILLVVYV